MPLAVGTGPIPTCSAEKQKPLFERFAAVNTLFFAASVAMNVSGADAL